LHPEVNWGGLVDRGGGNDDYDQMHDVADLDKIQNPVVGQHIGPYPWRIAVEYEYRLDRGARVGFLGTGTVSAPAAWNRF
jgi:hypothetical protein